MVKLELNKISFWFKSSEIKIIDEFSSKFNSPNAIAIIGINGCGKTSILKLISGYLTPKEGKIIINDKIVKDVNSRKNLVTYVPENARLFLIGPTPRKDLKRIIKDEKKVDTLFKKYNLESLADKKIYKLSEGQRRLIALFISFQTDSKILLFDEPTIGLDTNGRAFFLKLMKKSKLDGKIIIIATNDNRILTHMNKILVIKDSKLFLNGEPREILYQLEEKTDLLPNQTVRLIYYAEKQLGKKIPHFLSIYELNDSIKEMKK